MVEPLICKAIMGNSKVEFESVETRGKTLSQTIQDDIRYGKLLPSNGKFYTYLIRNEDAEFQRPEIKKAIQHAFFRWSLYLKLPPLREYRGTGEPDLKIEFRTVQSDPEKQLTASTIMYMYYPIQKHDHPLRGLCVVNKAFFFTSHGDSVTGHELIKHGIQVQFPDGHYETIDADTVLFHEFGHGVIGLPHDDFANQGMSSNYGDMAEYPNGRDQSRGMAKFGWRNRTARGLLRLLRWLRVASDR